MYMSMHQRLFQRILSHRSLDQSKILINMIYQFYFVKYQNLQFHYQLKLILNPITPMMIISKRIISLSNKNIHKNKLSYGNRLTLYKYYKFSNQQNNQNQFKQKRKEQRLKQAKKSLAHSAEIQIKYQKLNKPNLDQLLDYFNSEGWKVKPHIRNGTLIQFTNQKDYSQQEGPIYQIKVLYQAKLPQANKTQKEKINDFSQRLQEQGQGQGMNKKQINLNLDFLIKKKEKTNQINDQTRKFNEIYVYIKAKNGKQIKIKDKTEQFQNKNQKKNYNKTKWMKVNIVFQNLSQNQAMEKQGQFHVFGIGFIQNFQKQLQKKDQKDINCLKNFNDIKALSKVIPFFQQLKLNQQFFNNIIQYAKKEEHKHYLEWLQDIKNQCK